MNPSIANALKELDEAAREAKLSAIAAKNIRDWLTEPRYAQYAPQVAEELAAGNWKQLDDVLDRSSPSAPAAAAANSIRSAQRHQRPHHRRNAQGLGRLRSRSTSPTGRRPAPSPTTRGTSHATSPSSVPGVMAAAGFSGLVPRRLSQHARAFVHRALQTLLVRNHHHRQPQPAQRQCDQGQAHRRAVAPAARSGRDRSRDGGDRRAL